jgi:hypothetical protein
MIQLSNKLIEQARQMPDDTSDALDELTDDEIKAKQKQAVLDYIKEYGVPKENE